MNRVGSEGIFLANVPALLLDVLQRVPPDGIHRAVEVVGCRQAGDQLLHVLMRLERALDMLLIAGSVRERGEKISFLDHRVQCEFHADDLRHVELGQRVTAGRPDFARRVRQYRAGASGQRPS